MSSLPTGTITFLLTDVEGSTALWEQAPEEMRAALSRHDALFERAVAEHGGVHVRSRGEGDSRFAVFPSAAEALTAALAIQRAFAAEPWPTPRPIKIRVGMHTGEAQLRDDDYYGSAVNRCARLRDLGHGGQVLLSETTESLVREALSDGVDLRELGVYRLRGLTHPERVFQLTAPDLPSDFPALASSRARSHNLPLHRSALVGREREIAEVGALLLRPDIGLVTLVGPGGTGKTRLATQVAAELLDRFEDGVRFVGLSPIRDPALVAATIGQALAIPMDGGRAPLDVVKSYLHDRELLLVLDNLEQVLDAAPQFAELLVAAPRLKLLVTSRVALRVSDERVYDVPPLSLPRHLQTIGGADAVLALAQYEAIRLFVERAQAANAGFALTSANAPDVVELCRRLDGLPLAIELAAARARLLPPSSMLARLAGPTSAPALRLLTGGPRDQPARLQTLRNTIAWSYDLLEPGEQVLFRRLAIFVDGCTIEAAEAAYEALPDAQALDLDDVLDGVDSLLAKNLLKRIEGVDGQQRYTMLETIREYGLESLALSGELPALQRWHAEHFLALAEEAEIGMRGSEQVAWMFRLQADQNNLRAALEWGLEPDGDPELVLRLCGALAWFWYNPGSHGGPHQEESRRRFTQALTVSTAPSLGRAKVLAGAGRVAHMQQESAVALPLIQESLAIACQIGDRWWTAWNLHLLGRVAYFENDPATATAFGQESLTLAQTIGDDWLVAWALHLLALASYVGDDLQASRHFFDESLAIRRRLGYSEGITLVLSLLGTVEYREGKYADALSRLAESLEGQHELDASWVVGNTLANLVAVAVTLGHLEVGARISGAVTEQMDAVGIRPIPIVAAIYQPAVEAARQGLGDVAFAAEQQRGRRLTLDEIIAELPGIDLANAPATGQASTPSPASTPPTRATSVLPDGLSAREAEVLKLIAAGSSTKEIAEQLVISSHTVERHITHVYQKIGARGRAEATAYALRHGLT